MTKTAYKCEGDFQMGRIRQTFSIEVVATSEEGARTALFAELGSRHSVKRRDVQITNVTALKPDQASDITRKRLE